MYASEFDRVLSALAFALLVGSEILVLLLLPVGYLKDMMGLPGWIAAGLDGIFIASAAAFAIWLGLRAWRAERNLALDPEG